MNGPILRRLWQSCLCLSAAAWLAVVLWMEKTNWLDSDGILHEPLFVLLPISWGLTFLTLALMLADLLRSRRR